jgi:demethylmenaquinone methyltransferase/2-methoxy-6-polyprenyl-1,4-benzoquinol methylase
MKILESAPSRYDRGIAWLTLGRVHRAYERLLTPVQPGDRILDIGCGTGALMLLAAQRGARVKGIDVNPEMLEIARKRVVVAGFGEQVELVEMGVAELDSEPAGYYDGVVSGLCFSELSPDEIAFALRAARRLLKPGGYLLVADEVQPAHCLKRILIRLVRLPLVAITYLVTQTTTRAVKDLPDQVRRAGFRIRSLRYNRVGNFLELTAQAERDQ